MTQQPSAPSEAKYQLGTPENKQFLDEQRDSLMAFGHRFPSPGGSSYWLGDDGTPWTDRNRETWITCRMTHVYSLGVLVGHPGSEALVDAGLKGLRGELHDEENGGWYPAALLTAPTRPTSRRTPTPSYCSRHPPRPWWAVPAPASCWTTRRKSS